jgi:DNA-binding MarR family transcriptional regulator
MAHSLEFDECRSCACFAVRKAARAVTQHYDRALRPHGLRATQFNVLALLAQTGPMPMAKLADLLGLDRTSLTRNLRPLVRRRCASVTEDDDDRRLRMAAITPGGISVIRKALPAWRAAQASAGSILDRSGIPILSR